MEVCGAHSLPEAQSVTIIEVLLEAGASPSLSNDQGCVPLHAAAVGELDDAIEILASVAPGTLNHGDEIRVTPMCAGAQGCRTHAALCRGD